MHSNRWPKVRERAIRHLVKLRSLLRTLDLNDDCGDLVVQLKRRLQAM